MGNLFSSIISVAGSMRAFQNGLDVVQNNVTNASTPGYAKQVHDFAALSFDITRGLPGGVVSRGLIDYRDGYAERIVWNQQQATGRADAQVDHLSQIESNFDISAGSGIAGSLGKLFQSFSQLSVSPNNSASRQVVLDRARHLAQMFNQTSAALGVAAGSAETAVRGAVEEVNSILGRLRQYNVQARQSIDSLNDPGLQANYHAALEELSGLVDFTMLQGADGTTTILIGGETPALIGDRLYPISAEVDSSGVKIRNAQGGDVTGQIEGGRLIGLTAVRNEHLPRYRVDLDSLAAGIADRVNAVLAGGVDASGNPPVQNLFSYDATAGAAATLYVEDLSTDQLAVAKAGAPGGNGNALELSQLANSKEIDGFTFAEYFGNLAASTGRDLSAARDEQETRAALLAQARSLRAESSQVSLDEEAARLIEYQRGFEAAAKLVGVLQELTETVVGLLR